MTAKGIWKGKVTVHTPPVRIPLDEAEQNFTGALDEAFNDPETHVHHIRAMVGLGKTREIIRRIVLGESFVYASPTHKLLNQVANDLRQQGFSDFVQIGELPRECFDESELFMIDLYHGLGCIGHAKKLLYDKQKQLREDVERLHTLGTIGGTEHDLAVSKYYSLRDYLKTIDEAQTTLKPLLITHERLLGGTFAHSTIVIDEDIIPSLLKLGTTYETDLVQFREHAPLELVDKVNRILSDVTSSADGEIHETPIFSFKSAPLEKLILEEDGITGNVLGLLNSNYYQVNIEDKRRVLRYIQKRTLPASKKIIILNATANRSISRMLWGDRCLFTSTGLVCETGTLYQDVSFSFSRSQLRTNKAMLNRAKSVIRDSPCITYKELKCEFNTISTFGGLRGENPDIGGNTLYVLGTPHVNESVYNLWCVALGQRLGLDYNTIHMIPMDRRGMSFYFMTYSSTDTLLREIQLYLIESELEQAIGRARLLRQDRRVILLSNLPIYGATFTDIIDKVNDEELKSA